LTDLGRIDVGDGEVVPDGVLDKAIARAMGEELRRVREAHSLSRAQFCERLPSGIGDRTILSYEHGTRHMTLVRFIELCHALGVSAPSLLVSALQRAQIYLDSLAVKVDVRALQADRDPKFWTLTTWAHNKLIEHPGGVVELAPSAVREIATMIGLPHEELTAYLARFTPEVEPDSETGNDGDPAAV
jgi:transcriptional regulator with XRE-family HTH domain